MHYISSIANEKRTLLTSLTLNAATQSTGVPKASLVSGLALPFSSDMTCAVFPS